MLAEGEVSDTEGCPYLREVYIFRGKTRLRHIKQLENNSRQLIFFPEEVGDSEKFIYTPNTERYRWIQGPIFISHEILYEGSLQNQSYRISWERPESVEV